MSKLRRPASARPGPQRRPPGRARTAGGARATGPAGRGEEGGKVLHVCGQPAVEALFSASPERILRLYFDEAHKTLVGDICVRLAEAHRQYRLVRGDELERIAGTSMHGGVVALAEPIGVPDLEASDLEAWALEGAPLLVLDGIGNPHNLGAIVRTAAFFGLPRILLSDHPGQALASDAAYRVARGGMEHVRLYRARSFLRRLEQIERHFKLVATSLKGGRSLADVLATASPVSPRGERPAPDRRPIALVLGNEEEGLPSATLAKCKEIVTLGGSGAVQSLNVAATAAILLHALVEQRASRLSAPGRPAP